MKNFIFRALRAEAEGRPHEYDDLCPTGVADRTKIQSGKTDTQPQQLLVTPNPASSYIDVYLPATFSGKEVWVADIYGRIVKTFSVNSDHHLTLDTHQLANGIYFLSAGSDLQAKFLISH